MNGRAMLRARGSRDDAPPSFLVHLEPHRLPASSTPPRRAGSTRTSSVARVDLDPDELRDVDTRVEMPRYLKLWGEAVARVGRSELRPLLAETWSSTHNLLRFSA